jgi:hypothetical protein
LPLARPIRVAAGNVGVELRAEGYLPSSRPVTITVGQLSRETMMLQRIEVAAVVSASPAAPPPLSLARGPSPPDPALPPMMAPPPRAPENAAGGWHRSAAWITGAAAVLFASGAAFALVTRGHYADQLSAAVRARRCVQDGDQFRGDGARDCAIAATNRDRAEALGLAGGGMAGACALASAIYFTVGGRF